jgi:hypothetical protein
MAHEKIPLHRCKDIKQYAKTIYAPMQRHKIARENYLCTDAKTQNST